MMVGMGVMINRGRTGGGMGKAGKFRGGGCETARVWGGRRGFQIGRWADQQSGHRARGSEKEESQSVLHRLGILKNAGLGLW